MNTTNETTSEKKGFVTKLLDSVERIGNKLPDPAILFFVLMLLIWVLSAIFSTLEFSEIDPSTGSAIQIHNLLTSAALAKFLSSMVTVFTSFAPLGIVLVAMCFFQKLDTVIYRCYTIGIHKKESVIPRLKAVLTPVIYIGYFSFLFRVNRN